MLLAWYPLDGNLEDYSGNLGNMTGDWTVDNNGKIGKCYKKNGAMTIPLTPREIGDTYTLCFWIYTDSTTTQTTLALFRHESPRTSFSYFQYPTRNDFHWSLNTNAGVDTGVLEDDQWTHVTVVVESGNKITRYYNGEFKGSRTGSINWEDDRNIELLAMDKTKINDVRIYDEALSLKEIKEIAKAKILHYNFNQFAESTENLCVYRNADGIYNPKTSSTWGAHIATKTYEQYPTPLGIRNVGKTVLVYDTSVGSGGGSIMGVSDTDKTRIKSNTKYTVSYYLWAEDNLEYTTRNMIYIRQYNSSGSQVQERGIFSKDNAESLGSNWWRVKGTFTTLESTSYFEVNLYVYPCKNISYRYFGMLIEEKNHATEYVAETRTDYVVDSSGFRNHSQTLGLTTTPQWIDNSVLGSGCYDFKGSNYICIGNKCKVTSTITISAWAYKTDWSTDATSRRILSCTEAGGWQLGFNDTAGYVSFPFYKAGVGYYRAEYSRSKISSGWHLITGVFDGRYGKLYIDGVLVNTVDTRSVGEIGYNAQNGIFIGAESGAKETEPYFGYFDGKIDDVRIYATALSDEDIKELYQSKGSISKNGKLFINEIVETPICETAPISKKLEINSTGWGGGRGSVKLDGTILHTVLRSYAVVSISQDLTTTKSANFDVYIDETKATEMIDYIKGLKDDDYIIIATHDHPTQNNGAISDYLSTFGLKHGTYSWNGRDAYIAVFRKKGEKYFEAHQRYISDDTPTNLYHFMELKTGSTINKTSQLITNEIIEIPTTNLETKTAYDADWVQIFYHNNKSGTVLFSSDKKEFMRCNTGDKISNLYLLELFRGKDGKFEFLLEYESESSSYNRWKQTSNFTNESISGYEAVQCSWTQNSWGGLELNTHNTQTWVDGSVNTGTWFYAIGARNSFSGGIPKWNGAETGWVKLWVRCDNPNIFKFYKDGSTRATEFIEN